jgi:hypothetical protein
LSDEFFHSLTHHYLENIFKAFDRMMLARYTRRKGTPRENVAEIDGFEFSFRCGETVLYGYGARREASIAIKALEAGLRELRKKAADINGQERKEK